MRGRNDRNVPRANQDLSSALQNDVDKAPSAHDLVCFMVVVIRWALLPRSASNRCVYISIKQANLISLYNYLVLSNPIPAFICVLLTAFLSVQTSILIPEETVAAIKHVCHVQLLLGDISL